MPRLLLLDHIDHLREREPELDLKPVQVVHPAGSSSVTVTTSFSSAAA